MPLTRNDDQPCPVSTDQYEWGNVCPRDPNGLGVHRCTLPASHRQDQLVPVDEAHPEGVAEAEWCVCVCGTRRPANRPMAKRG